MRSKKGVGRRTKDVNMRGKAIVKAMREAQGKQLASDLGGGGGVCTGHLLGYSDIFSYGGEESSPDGGGELTP